MDIDKVQEVFDKVAENQRRALVLGEQIGNMSLRTKDEALRFAVLAGFHRALWKQNTLFLEDMRKRRA